MPVVYRDVHDAVAHEVVQRGEPGSEGHEGLELIGLDPTHHLSSDPISQHRRLLRQPRHALRGTESK